jgi:hypothetical protein
MISFDFGDVLCPICGAYFDVKNNRLFSISMDGDGKCTPVECPNCGRKGHVTVSIDWEVKSNE